MLDGTTFFYIYTSPSPLPLYRHPYIHSKQERPCLRKHDCAEQYRAWSYKHIAQPLFTHLQTLSFSWYFSMLFHHKNTLIPLFFHLCSCIYICHKKPLAILKGSSLHLKNVSHVHLGSD